MLNIRNAFKNEYFHRQHSLEHTEKSQQNDQYLRLNVRLRYIINPFVWDTIVTSLAEKSHFMTIVHAHITVYTMYITLVYELLYCM